MLYLQKGQMNELILNINNNSRTDFTGYTFIMYNKYCNPLALVKIK